jgi:hypothetical protein
VFPGPTSNPGSNRASVAFQATPVNPALTRVANTPAPNWARPVQDMDSLPRENSDPYRPPSIYSSVEYGSLNSRSSNDPNRFESQYVQAEHSVHHTASTPAITQAYYGSDPAMNSQQAWNQTAQSAYPANATGPQPPYSIQTTTRLQETPAGYVAYHSAHHSLNRGSVSPQPGSSVSLSRPNPYQQGAPK